MYTAAGRVGATCINTRYQVGHIVAAEDSATSFHKRRDRSMNMQQPATRHEHHPCVRQIEGDIERERKLLIRTYQVPGSISALRPRTTMNININWYEYTFAAAVSHSMIDTGRDSKQSGRASDTSSKGKPNHHSYK